MAQAKYKKIYYVGNFSLQEISRVCKSSYMHHTDACACAHIEQLNKRQVADDNCSGARLPQTHARAY